MTHLLMTGLTPSANRSRVNSVSMRPNVISEPSSLRLNDRRDSGCMRGPLVGGKVSVGLSPEHTVPAAAAHQKFLADCRTRWFNMGPAPSPADTLPRTPAIKRLLALALLPLLACAAAAAEPPFPVGDGEAIALDRAIPANERGITCLTLDDKGRVFGGTTGRVMHLFVYDPATGDVRSLARLAGGTGFA